MDRRVLSSRRLSAVRGMAYHRRVMSQGFAPQLPQRVLPDPRFLVVPQLGQEQALSRIRAEICDGAFRPPDAAEAAQIEAIHALFVPFWRVEIAWPDSAVRVAEERRGYLGVPISQLGANDGRSAWMVCARYGFPYEMKHPSLSIPGDTRPLVLPAGLLLAGDPDPRYGWEEVETDIDVYSGEAMAMTAYRKFSIEPNHLFGNAEPIVRAIHFVRYPLWLARYRYRTEVAPTPDGLFQVGISAVDGAPITAAHPSKLAAGAAKLKKLFNFKG
jgi:hypothetical protein